MGTNLSLFYSKHRTRIRKTALWIAAVVALWAVVAGLVLPPILRRTAEEQLSKNLGSACTLAEVRFNPFTLRLAARNLRIPLPDGQEFFSLQGFEVRLSPATLYRFAPVLSDVRLTAPSVNLALHRDGRLSISALMENLRKNSPPPKEQPPEVNAGKGMNLFGLVVTDLELRSGRFFFHDEIRGADQTVTDLSFFVPFTSTLNRYRDRPITPFLEAVVNGRPLRVDGQLTPFAEQWRTEFQIRLDGLELARFQPYAAPFTTAVVKDGRLSTALVFSMAQVPDTGLRLGLGGNATLADLKILAPDGAEALRLPRLSVDLDGSLNTPEGLTLKQVTVEGLEARLALLADGRLDWQSWLKPVPAAAAPAARAGTPQLPVPIRVARCDFRQGRLLWEDRRVTGGFQGRAEQIAFTLTDLRLPGTAPAELQGSLLLNGGAPLSLEGKLALLPLKGDLRLRLDGLSLPDFQPYVTDSKVAVTLNKGLFHFAGRLDLAETDGKVSLLLREGEAGLKDLSLLRRGGSEPFFLLGDLTLTGLTVDPQARQAEAARLVVDHPDLRLVRDRNGHIDLADLAPAPASAADTPSAGSPGGAVQETPAAPWRVRLAELKLQSGRVAATLEAPRETTIAAFRELDGTLTGLDTRAGAALAVELSGRGEKGGSLRLDGKGTAEPLDLDLHLRLNRLNLKPLSPLLAAVSSDLRLGSGLLSLQLHSALTGKGGENAARVRGSVVLDHLSLLDVRREFAALRTLRVEGLDVDTGRQRYGAGKVAMMRPRVQVVVDKEGRSNLSRLLGGAPEAAEATPAPPAATTTGDTGNKPYLQFKDVEVREGTLGLSDERYQPKVENRLDKLAVTIHGLESAPDSQAQVSFDGELDGAPIHGQGTVNPLLADFRADLVAELSRLDVTPFSPMSERYIAYPLRKGVFTLSSKILVDAGRLDSSHRIRLDALTLGDKVKSPDAPNLPVKLGVSLLQDPAGNIDITLPVRGDLNDPSFSVGGLVLKAIVNLLMKAVTSPFTLLGGMLGSGDQGLEFIPFNPGEGRLMARDSQGLAAVAEMLAARPKIGLVLIPQAGEEDRRHLADAFVLRSMQELKYEDLPKKERATVKPQELAVGPDKDADEYQKLLFKVYKEQPFDKPKNFLGMVRELPPGEMMEKIRGHYPKDDAALEKLARERAENLRQAFLALRPGLEPRISIAKPQVPGAGSRVVFGIK
jgi:uncharacterized protein involved in outer membrane biogenesis